MKLGIDAQHLSHDLTGIGRYTWEMLKELSQQPTQIVAYLPSAPVVDTASLPQVQFKIANMPSSLGRTLWAQTVLPWQAQQDDLDVFWSPAHRLPWLLSRRIPTAVTIHDVTWKIVPETMRRSTYWLERLCMPWALRRAQAILSDSQATTRDLVRLGMADAKKIHTVALGRTALPEPGPAGMLQARGIEPNYFLFVGTLEPRKNLSALLAAYASLQAQVKRSMQLVIVGGRGWGNLNLPDLLAQHQLHSHVKVLGFVDDALLSTLYKHAQFLAMPSLYEGFGLPALEAMAQGRCVLASAGTSIAEIVQDCGLLVDPRNTPQIARALHQLITEPAICQQLAAQAAQVAARFTWAGCGQQTLQALRLAQQATIK
ncbi:MAG: glycosyltransferase family 4 protein [Brachymonas sp.]